MQSASRNVGAGLGALTVTTVSALVAPDFGSAYPSQPALQFQLIVNRQIKRCRLPSQNNIPIICEYYGIIAESGSRINRTEH